MRYIIAIIITFCIFSTVHAQEPSHIPGTELQWGMPYSQARKIFPGTYDGFVMIRQQQFADLPKTHPVIGQYYFMPDQTLGYAQFTPAYQHRAHPEYWIGEYNHINKYMTNIYGNPTSEIKNRVIWQSPETQGQLIQNSIQQNGQNIQTGWIFRFDPIEEGEE